MKAKARSSRSRKSATAMPAPPPMLHARWLAYLLITGHTTKAIRQLCKDVDLPAPSDEVLGQLRATLPLQEGGTLPPAKQKALLEQLGLAHLAGETPVAGEAFVILRTPRVRELVEAAHLLAVPADRVTATLATHLGVGISVEGLKAYTAFFFDCSRATRSQLRVLVQARVRQAVLRVVGDDADGTAAKRAIEADARTLAVTLASSPSAWSAVLLALGLPTGRNDLSKAVGELAQVATARAAQALLRGGPDDERRAESFTGVLRNLRQISEDLKTPGADLERQLLQIRLRCDPTEAKTLDDLRRAGDEVGDGGAIRVAQEVAVDLEDDEDANDETGRRR